MQEKSDQLGKVGVLPIWYPVTDGTDHSALYETLVDIVSRLNPNDLEMNYNVFTNLKPEPDALMEIAYSLNDFFCKHDIYLYETLGYKQAIKAAEFILDQKDLKLDNDARSNLISYTAMYYLKIGDFVNAMTRLDYISHSKINKIYDLATAYSYEETLHDHKNLNFFKKNKAHMDISVRNCNGEVCPLRFKQILAFTYQNCFNYKKAMRILKDMIEEMEASCEKNNCIHKKDIPAMKAITYNSMGVLKKVKKQEQKMV